MMSGGAPGRCADCGADAYIQLALGDTMLCAHCYQDRLGLKKKAMGRKGGEPAISTNPIPFRPRPSS
jgi:hypothetical protein